MKYKIEVTGIDLVEFAKKVYELSVAQGLGFLQFQNGTLSDEMAKDMVTDKGFRFILNMDYVNGRACKMKVIKKDNKLYIDDYWYDHTDVQFKQLLSHFNIEVNNTTEHSPACNCTDCQVKRTNINGF